MTAFIVISAVLAYLAGYFWIGWRLAKRDLPNAWRRARDRWTVGSLVQDSVREQTFCTVLFWPFVSPIRGMNARFRAVVDAGDPRERERELARREAEIARMEHELGIGQTP